MKDDEIRDTDEYLSTWMTLSIIISIAIFLFFLLYYLKKDGQDDNYKKDNSFYSEDTECSTRVSSSHDAIIYVSEAKSKRQILPRKILHFSNNYDQNLVRRIKD